MTSKPRSIQLIKVVFIAIKAGFTKFQIMAMLGEQFMVESELCGAVVSLRFQVLMLLSFISGKFCCLFRIRKVLVIEEVKLY